MSIVEVNKPAPDFTFLDFEGNEFHLSALEGKKHVLLVLNRGFA